MLTRKEYLLHNIEDPENLDSLASLDISEVENRQLNDCGFKYKISEIDGINKNTMNGIAEKVKNMIHSSDQEMVMLGIQMAKKLSQKHQILLIKYMNSSRYRAKENNYKQMANI